MLEALRRQLRALLDQRAAHQQDIETILSTVEAEDRSDLTDSEQAAFDTARAAIDEIDENVSTLQERIADLERLEARNREAAAVAARLGGDMPRVYVVDEPSVYNPESARRGVSFFRDLIHRYVDPAADERLRRHAAATAAMEQRDIGTGAVSGLVPPQYLVDLVAPKRRAGRPVANLCNAHELPPSGMTVDISRITTGSAAAAQASENATVQETDMDDTLLTVHVRTIAGQQDVSRQAIERGVGVDEIVIADLVAAYNTVLDSQLLNGDGTNGTHLGIRSTSGIVSVSYTDATPTAAELYPKLADVIQKIQASAFLGVSHFVMHPRRWWWIAKELGSTFPLLQMPGTAPQVAGTAGGTAYDDTNRLLFGVPVILDGNVPTNLGAGTNEDVIIAVTADELHLWEEPGSPLRVRADEVGSANLTVKFVVYGFTAFTAGRYPDAHGVVSGTGLVTPSF